MFDKTIKIKPVNYQPAPIRIENIVIHDVLVKLNETAIISGAHIDINGNGISPFTLIMDKVDYDKWATDDSFIIDYTLQKLGLEKV